MDIRIIKESEVPLRLQLGRQIAFLIASGQLKPGDALPSVRALATRLKIHYNTVSQAYRDLVNYHLVERCHGSRMVVPLPDKFPNFPCEKIRADFIGIDFTRNCSNTSYGKHYIWPTAPS